ncbi:putative SWI/SNF-related matrix-associated actin-dependent regulator of chromatin subfamily A member 3-like 1 isoform X1 [Teleopsis dalmanni]|uniref:putative SWI/SNF-related matrix-associated actin-dependent regulator of chromatin subfamily A member 3-like 1 isoform X1 n=1 Tax=Teleopsis dalmanni TaxID=139649 RepID=UPI0018CD4F40|nr:putative SWI/SNF-related matrix-associated actin-dependent regulator of chromatin subfamily A member 3-like 1 isoform X1 [Teleopsis dalmanni]
MSSNKADLSAVIRTPDRAEYPRLFSPSTPALLAEIRQMNRFLDGVHQVNVQPLATDSPTVQLDEVISLSDLSISSEEDDDIVFVPNVIDLCSTESENSAENSEIEHQVMCPICIAPMTVPVCTKCGHVFCEACINRAVDTSKKCPLCKANILKKQLRRIFW